MDSAPYSFSVSNFVRHNKNPVDIYVLQCIFTVFNGLSRNYDYSMGIIVFRNLLAETQQKGYLKICLRAWANIK